MFLGIRFEVGRSVYPDLFFIFIFVVVVMEIAVAGRTSSRVRPPRPALESSKFSYSSQGVSQSSSCGWVASSLIGSNVCITPSTPLMDLSLPVPRSRSIQVGIFVFWVRFANCRVFGSGIDV